MQELLTIAAVVVAVIAALALTGALQAFFVWLFKEGTVSLSSFKGMKIVKDGPKPNCFDIYPLVPCGVEPLRDAERKPLRVNVWMPQSGFAVIPFFVKSVDNREIVVTGANSRDPGYTFRFLRRNGMRVEEGPHNESDVFHNQFILPDDLERLEKLVPYVVTLDDLIEDDDPQLVLLETHEPQDLQLVQI